MSREPKPLGEALGKALASEDIEQHFGQHASRARREGEDYVLEFPDGKVLKGDRLLVATGRKPRLEGIGLENVGIEPGKRGIGVDARMSAGEGIWAIGDVTGIWPLTYVGKYQGRVAAANILGRGAEANYDAVPRVVFTDPQAVAVGEAEGEVTVTVSLDSVPRTSTYYREYEDAGFLTLVSDGRAAHGRVRARARGGRVARPGDARDPGAGADRRPEGHDPALPDLLRGLPVRDAGADSDRAGVDPSRPWPRRPISLPGPARRS